MTEVSDIILPLKRVYKNTRKKLLDLLIKNQLFCIEKINLIINLKEYITVLINII